MDFNIYQSAYAINMNESLQNMNKIIKNQSNERLVNTNTSRIQQIVRIPKPFEIIKCGSWLIKI